MSLTPTGAQFLATLTPAFDEIADAAEAFDEVEGRVRIHVEPIFATRWLMPRMAAFSEAHPKIEVQIEASEMLADMARFEADLAVRFFKEGTPDRPADLISDAPLYPYAAPGLVDIPLKAPEDLLSYKLYRDRRGYMWQEWFQAAGGDPALVPEMGFRMRSALCVEAAVNRMGVILASSEVMDYEVRLGRLERISDVAIRRGSHHLIYGEGVARRRAVRVYRDWLLEASADLRSS